MATSKIPKVITPSDKIIVLKSYTFEYTVPSNNYLNISGSDLGLSIPEGMRVIGLRYYDTGNSTVYAAMIQHSTNGTSARLRTYNGDTASGTLSVGFIYVMSSMVDS